MINAFRSLVQHNLAAKILSLSVAIVLWGYVMNDQNPTIEGSFTVNVRLVNAPEGYNITQDTDTVKLKVKGARSLFVANKASDFDAYVDLADAQSGVNAYKIHTVLPQGFELISLSTDTIDVTLDKLISRRVRADININGTPADGMTLAGVSQASDTVTVYGAESVVKNVARVIGYIGLTAKNDADFSLNVPLTAINADGREVQGVTLKQSTMPVKIQLARGLTKKIVAIKVPTADDLAAGLDMVSLKSDPAKIEIAGDEKNIAKIDYIETEKIDLKDITKDTERTVKLVLPEGVTVTNREVTVHIAVKSVNANTNADVKPKTE